MRTLPGLFRMQGDAIAADSTTSKETSDAHVECNAVTDATFTRRPTDTVNALLARAVATVPDRTLLDFSGVKFTYAEVDAMANRMAHGLLALGVSPGDTVCSVLDNGPNAVFVWLAINKAGAISVPVNTALKGEFLRHQLSDAGATVIIAEEDYAARVAAIAEQLPALRTLVVHGATPTTHVTTMTLAALSAHDATPVDAAPKPEDLMALIYTGGTTGPSKGCMISHNYACNLAWQAIDVMQRKTNEINWSPLPLFHFNAVACTVLASIAIGSTASLYTRFSVSNFWPEIERSGAKIVSLIGSMIPLIANAAETEAERRCFGQVRLVLGAPFPPEMQHRWLKRFGVIHAGANNFGLTESCLLTSLPFGQDAPPGSSGKRNEHFDVEILNDAGDELPADEPGEIVIRPKRPHIMFEGYWRRPEDTAKVIRDGWFHTGDIGKFDGDGFFYFVDRKKDYLRRRGENISSFEVETAFRAHPDIEDVAAHAVPSGLTEDDLKVTAIRRAGSALTERELCLWAIDQLPYFAVPRYIEFRKELPRSELGRVLKYKLRDEGKTPTTFDLENSGIQIKKR